MSAPEQSPPRIEKDGQAQRRLAAIMFTDMVGYSALMQKDERNAVSLVHQQDSILNPIFETHSGTVIKTMGDGILVEFASALHAVRCAVEIQKTLVEHNRGVAPADRIRIRIGLHVGDVEHKNGDILGDAANIAARIEPFAEADGICVSEDVARQVGGKIGEPFESIGRHELKNIGPVTLYRVRLPWTALKVRRKREHVASAALVILAFVLGVVAGVVADRNWPSRKNAMSHSRRVNAVAFSPDGHLIASASDDQTIRLWDVGKQKLVRTLSGHSRAVYHVAFSPDGKLLASGSADHTVRLWSASDGQQLQVLKGHTAPVQSVAFSPKGRILASGANDGTVILWDVTTGSIAQKLSGHQDAVNALAFSPDGETLASSSDDETIRLWDTATGKQLRHFRGHRGAVNDISFRPNGDWLASGGEDGTVRLWDVNTGDEIHNLSGHKDTVLAVAFSPSGRWLVSSGNDFTLRLWDAATGEQVREFAVQSSTIDTLAWSTAGLVGCGNDDGAVTLRDLGVR